MKCKVEGCEFHVKTKKSMLCEKHYFRIRRHGTTDKISSFCVGDIYPTKNYGDLIIVNYLNYNNVSVRFLVTGFESVTNAGSITNGSVKDLMHPRVFGVGYVGVGTHKPTIKGNRTASYSRWIDMLRRCYSEKFIANNKSYTNCKVCDEWHSFQVFSDWFYENYKYGCDLDKDILSGENKIYSPVTCCFVSPEVNSLYARGCMDKEYCISKDGNNFKFNNINKASKELGLDCGNLCRLVNNKTKSHKGWINNG
jgi:hypothetical protein